MKFACNWKTSTPALSQSFVGMSRVGENLSWKSSRTHGVRRWQLVKRAWGTALLWDWKPEKFVGRASRVKKVLTSSWLVYYYKETSDKLIIYKSICYRGFTCSSVGKERTCVQESACSAGEPGLIPGFGGSPGGGHGNPLQDSCLENPMDRVAWLATVQESDMT